MSNEVGNRVRSSTASARTFARSGGRIAIWAAVGMLLIRGLGSVLAHPATPVPAFTPTGEADRASAAFAVRFARAYLGNPSPRALSPFLAEGTRIGAGRPPAARHAGVVQAEVTAVKALGEGRAVLTVACDLRDSRTLYLAVPIARSRAGEVAALGAPSIVAAPSTAGVAPERSRPVAGVEGPAIQALVDGFLPSYVSASSPQDLAYYLAPGAAVRPLGDALRLLGAPGAAAQLDGREGPRRTVAVSPRLRDPLSGAVYLPTYRIELVKRDRWYVEGLQGALR